MNISNSKCTFSFLILLILVGHTVQNAQTISISRFLSSKDKPLSISKHTVLKNKKSKLSTKKSYYPVNALTTKYTSWAINPKFKKSSINLMPVWEKYTKKKDIVVAVIDTGIDPNHPYLKNNLHVINGTKGSKNYGVDFSGKKSTKTPKDSHGHGTHVSGIVKSIFPEVKILALKYFNPNANGQINLKSAIQALKYAIDANVDIINYSGGGPEPSLEELRVLKIAEKKGILIIAAAGNEKQNIDDSQKAYYPASYGLKNIITVSSHDRENKMLRSSNWGYKSVDISAPGHQIRSSHKNGNASYMTGTSQATAFVTGVAALIKSRYPNLNCVDVKKAIVSSARKEKTLIAKSSSGGRLDALGSFNRAGELSYSLAISNQVSKKINKRVLAGVKKIKTTSQVKKNIPVFLKGTRKHSQISK